LTTQEILELDDNQIIEFTDIEYREDSWIYLFIGTQGQGKSLAASYFVDKIRRKTERKVFYFPASLKLRNATLINITQLATFAELPPDDDNPSEIDNGILLIDEIHLIMNKYRSNTWGNRMVQAFLSQIRKRGVIVFSTTNSPNQLDESFVERVNFHGKCLKYNDKRCKDESIKAGLPKVMHLTACKDSIHIRMTDTQGFFGRSHRHFDGRKRKWVHIPKAINYYRGLYNTDATVSAIEISQLSRENIESAAETAKTGNDYGDFLIKMQQEIIPALVHAGGKMLYPAAFKGTLLEQWELDVSVERIGHACTDLGLESKRGAKGKRYILPEPERLELFVAGVG
jgi:hypothetical protein